MALEQEIQEAIDSDLPNQIGQRLKTRLERADADEFALKAALEELTSAQSENAMLRERERELDNIEAREEAIAANEREYAKQMEILGIKEQYADKGRADMFNLLQAVFKGPVSAPLAFHADLYGNVQTPMGSNSASLSGDVEQKDA